MQIGEETSFLMVAFSAAKSSGCPCDHKTFHFAMLTCRISNFGSPGRWV